MSFNPSDHPLEIDRNSLHTFVTIDKVGFDLERITFLVRGEIPSKPWNQTGIP
jgi:hypothetical protein